MLSEISPRHLFLIAANLLSLLAIIGLSSCSKDEDAPQDKTAPVVSFSNTTSISPVWNTVPFKLNVTDNDGIKTVEIFVDGDLVATLSNSPYEFDWDSHTVPDGSHTVKVIATDASGNKSEAQVTIIVKNILISIDVPDGHVVDTEDHTLRKFIVLTDEGGNVIAYSELHNGTKVELKSPSFDGSSFYLSEVRYIREAWNDNWQRTDVCTFAEIDRGTWNSFLEGAYPENIVQANLDFQNAEAGVSYIISTNADNTWQETEANQFSTTMDITSPSSLFIQKSESGIPVSWRLIPSVVGGNNPTIDLSQDWQPMSSATRSVPDGLDYVHSDLWGYAGDGEERYFVGEGRYLPGQNKLEIYKPGDAFPHYLHDYWFGKDNYSVFRSSPSLEASFAPIAHTINVDMTADGYDFNAIGEFDYAFLTFEKTGHHTNWFFVLPGNSEGTIIPPLMPQEIKELMDIPVFSFTGMSSYSLVNYDVFESYEDFITTYRDSELLSNIGISDHGFSEMEVIVQNEEGGRLPARNAGVKRLKHLQVFNTKARVTRHYK
jgi:hypothetical protein